METKSIKIQIIIRGKRYVTLYLVKENGCEIMQYENVIQGIFSQKLNRFVAEVYVQGKLEKVHIKNTGRLKEMLKPGAIIALELASNPDRKTKYSIIAAKKEDVWVNIDSQIPNKVAYGAITDGKMKEFLGITGLKREVTYEGSRFDLFYQRDETPGFIEVKGVTLEQDGHAMFPDAPTLRGTKHVETLIKAVEAGYEASILFIIQMKGCHIFTPNRKMDPVFYEALCQAAEKGVRLIAYDCIVTESTITLNQEVPISL